MTFLPHHPQYGTLPHEDEEEASHNPHLRIASHHQQHLHHDSHLTILRTPLTPMPPSSGLPTFVMIATGAAEPEGPVALSSSQPLENSRGVLSARSEGSPLLKVSSPRRTTSHAIVDVHPEHVVPLKKVRSLSAPTRPITRMKGTLREISPLPASPIDPEKNIKKTAAQAFAKSVFFHASFTSSHGAMLMRQAPRFTTSIHSTHLAATATSRRGPATSSAPAGAAQSSTVPQKSVRDVAGSGGGAKEQQLKLRQRSLLLMPPSMRQRYLQQIGPQGAAAYQMANRPPRLVIPTDADASPLRRRTLSGGSARPAAAASPTTSTPLQRTLPPKRSTGLNEKMPLLCHGSPVQSPEQTPPHTAVPRYTVATAPSTPYGHVPLGPPRFFSIPRKDLRRIESYHSVAGDGSIDEGEDDELIIEDEVEEGEPVTIMDALMELLPLAAPSAVTMALTFALSSIPLMFIGSHLGEKKLTGASIGYFIISIVAQYPIFGLTFALDTLASHEYGRNPDSDVLGVLLQRGIIVNLAFGVPMSVALVYCSQAALTPIYGALMATIAADFLRYAPLFLIPLVIFIAFSKFCANQMLPQIPTIAMTCGLIVTPIAQRSLIHLGVEGSMLGMAIAAWTQLAVIIILTFAKKQTRLTFGALRFEDALDWDDVVAYLKLALPSALFVAAEASAFDLSVLLAARIGSAQGAAWSAILNSTLPFVGVAGGLSAAACAKVGASLGAGYPNDARRYALTAVGAAAVCACVNACVIWTFYDVLLELFGTQGEALTQANTLLYIVPLMHIGDSVQFAFQGVFSGCGRNHQGAVILLSSLWAIGVPVACYMAFWQQLGLQGIVIGITVGLLVEAPAMVWAAHRMDWQQLAEDAQVEALEDDEEEEDEEHAEEGDEEMEGDEEEGDDEEEDEEDDDEPPKSDNDDGIYQRCESRVLSGSAIDRQKPKKKQRRGRSRTRKEQLSI
jgi:multidrug resistance protein, MATE family